MNQVKLALSKAVIKFLHLSDRKYGNYRLQLTIYYFLKRLTRIFYSKEIRDSISFIPQNHGYGHEYWLKKYSHWNKPIYGEIEHGIYYWKE